MKIALGIEYDGSHFHGWQTQTGVATVQETLEAALSRIADHPVRVTCAGRTDAGVHAVCQVAHFVTEARRDLRAWVHGSNAHLKGGISVLWAVSVPQSFNARFAATSRHYRYAILSRATRPALLQGRATWDYRPLEVTAMSAAARHLLGEHDFSSFRAQACQAKSPVRTIRRLEVSRRGELVILDVVAKAFLHPLVRNIAGVLMAIGAGKQPVDWALEVLRARDRALGGVTAPPDGLYLMGVEYPESFALPGVPKTLPFA